MMKGFLAKQSPFCSALLLCVVGLLPNNSAWSAPDPKPVIAQGFVYEDIDRNGRRDDGEPGIPGVRVSNQREIVLTDAEGRWQLPARPETIFFVIKPRGWTTAVNDRQLPQFYHIHKAKGSGRLYYPGTEPTRKLPGAIDFGLFRQEEPDQFQVLVFADTQPRDLREIDYIRRDVLEELLGTTAKFGVTLGDIVFNDLSLFDPLNEAIAKLGIPWRHVIGNHDMNLDSLSEKHSDEAYERTYGPNYYSFDYGSVHFIALDDVFWEGAHPMSTGKYHPELGAEQIEFVSRDLEFTAPDQLVVLMMHIPLYAVSDRAALFTALQKRTNVVSLSGHTHWQTQRFFGPEEGWNGPQPHHHFVMGAVCGGWWSGLPDEYGIPHAMMADGTPNGYSILSFDGTRVRFDFKAARRAADYQMHVYLPASIPSGASGGFSVWVNVFAGNERSKVEMRLDDSEHWTSLKKVKEPDPFFVELKLLEPPIPVFPWRNLPQPNNSEHLWKASLPDNLSPGVHRLNVRTIDMYGRTFKAEKFFAVQPEKKSEEEKEL